MSITLDKLLELECASQCGDYDGDKLIDALIIVTTDWKNYNFKIQTIENIFVQYLDNKFVFSTEQIDRIIKIEYPKTIVTNFLHILFQYEHCLTQKQFDKIYRTVYIEEKYIEKFGLVQQDDLVIWHILGMRPLYRKYTKINYNKLENIMPQIEQHTREFKDLSIAFLYMLNKRKNESELLGFFIKYSDDISLVKQLIQFMKDNKININIYPHWFNDCDFTLKDLEI